MDGRTFSREFKLSVMRELEAGKSVAEVCRQHNLKKDPIYRWKREYKKNPTLAFAGNGNVSSVEARNAELERMVGRLHSAIGYKPPAKYEREILKKIVA